MIAKNIILFICKDVRIKSIVHAVSIKVCDQSEPLPRVSWNLKKKLVVLLAHNYNIPSLSVLCPELQAEISLLVFYDLSFAHMLLWVFFPIILSAGTCFLYTIKRTYFKLNGNEVICSFYKIPNICLKARV